MKQYSKTDQEYRGNGHYEIDGVEYMSIWTYKNKNNVGVNTNQANGSDAISLGSAGITAVRTKPDFGNFDNIYVYPVMDLDGFYKK